MCTTHVTIMNEPQVPASIVSSFSSTHTHIHTHTNIDDVQLSQTCTRRGLRSTQNWLRGLATTLDTFLRGFPVLLDICCCIRHSNFFFNVKNESLAFKFGASFIFCISIVIGCPVCFTEVNGSDCKFENKYKLLDANDNLV